MEKFRQSAVLDAADLNMEFHSANEKGKAESKEDINEKTIQCKPSKLNDDIKVDVTRDNVRLLGRTYTDSEDGFTYFSWSNSGFEFKFYGTGAEAYFNTNIPENEIKDNEDNMPILSIYLDNMDAPEDVYKIFRLDKKEGWYMLAEGLEEGYHTITVRKRNRSYFGTLVGVACGVNQLKIKDGNLKEAPKSKELKLEVIGDSISCGDGIYADVNKYGGTQVDGWSTYAAEAARNLDADLNTIAISGNGLISSVFGTTLLELPAQFPYTDRQIYREDGKEVKWNYSKYQSDVVVINLGTNDRAGVGEGKMFTEQDFENTYVEFMEYIKSVYHHCKIIACIGAMGSELKPSIEKAVERVNEKGRKYVYTLWFTPDIANDGLSADETHPSLKAHKRYGIELTDKIKKVLELD